MEHHSHAAEMVTGLMVLCGALFMFVAILRGDKTSKQLPHEVRSQWRIMTGLMVFFFLGYIAFLVLLAGHIIFPMELVTGLVFLGGAVFVYLVIGLTRDTIARIKIAEKNLTELNETLENRVEERTVDLQESEKRYRMLFESAGDAIFILEAEGAQTGTIVAANTAAAVVHGYTVDELIGKNIKDLDVPDAAQNVPHLMQRILQGEWIKTEVRHFKKDGTVFPMEVSAGLLELGDHKYALAFDRDISERKKAEEQLQRYAGELKRSNEDVLSFAYIVSHDLRAPLVSIRGFTGELGQTLGNIESLFAQCMSRLNEEECAQLEAAFKVDAPEAMKFIDASAGRMEGLINNILMLSRSGHRELKPELIDMKELARSIFSSLEHQVEQHKTSVLIGELPVITADKLALEQIMGNLLDNALKYLDQEREGKITITAEQSEQETTFHVRDNGRGIAKEELTKVFDIFHRAGERNIRGEGMGLSYVKTLVRRYGGSIWCESEPGVGSVFSFSIPRSPLVNA